MTRPLSPDPAGEPHQSDQSEHSVGSIAADRWAIVYRDDSAADREGEPDNWPEIETSTVNCQGYCSYHCPLYLGYLFSYQNHKLKLAKQQNQLAN